MLFFTSSEAPLPVLEMFKVRLGRALGHLTWLYSWPYFQQKVGRRLPEVPSDPSYPTILHVGRCHCHLPGKNIPLKPGQAGPFLCRVFFSVVLVWSPLPACCWLPHVFTCFGCTWLNKVKQSHLRDSEGTQFSNLVKELYKGGEWTP